MNVQSYLLTQALTISHNSWSPELWHLEYLCHMCANCYRAVICMECDQYLQPGTFTLHWVHTHDISRFFIYYYASLSRPEGRGVASRQSGGCVCILPHICYMLLQVTTGYHELVFLGRNVNWSVYLDTFSFNPWFPISLYMGNTVII